MRLGLKRDFEMVEIAREKDYFTICYGYTEEQTVGLAAAGCDVIVPHAGWTTGGLAGAGASALSLDQACEHVQHLIDLARQENPEIICLSHGGPIAGPEDTRYLYEHTDCPGLPRRLERGAHSRRGGGDRHRPRVQEPGGCAEEVVSR